MDRMLIVLQVISAAIALILTPGLLFHFDVTPKIAVLLAGTSLALLFFRKNCDGLWAFVRTTKGFWFTVVLLAQLIWMGVTCFYSSSAELSLFGGEWRRFGLVTLAALVVLTLLSAALMAASENAIPVLLRAVVLSGAVLSFYGILQYFRIDPFISAKAYIAGEGPFQIVRPPGTFGHADYFATWLVFVVFAGVAAGWLDQRRWMRMIAWATVVEAILAILLTGTRAALVGLAAGILVLLAYRAIPLKRFATAFFAGALILGIFVISPAGSGVRARVHWSGDDVRGGARLLLWRDSLKMAMQHPVTGVGPETFGLRFPQYESVDLARAYPDFYHESAHNILLDELTAEGLPGLLLFLAMVVLAVWPAKGNRLVRCLTAAFFALFVCQQFSVFVAGTAFAFYLCAAMLVAAKTPTIEARISAKWFAIPSLALIVSFGVYAVKVTVGDYYLARAEVDKAAAWLPPGPAEDIYFSRKTGSVALAIRAVKTSEDRQNAWYNLAVMLAQQNDLVGVERSLRSAIAWAPNWFKPHWKLAEVLALSGHPAEALIEAKKAVDLDGGRDPEVSATYRRLIFTISLPK